MKQRTIAQSARLVWRNWQYAMALRALMKAQARFEKLEDPMLCTLTYKLAEVAYQKLNEDQ